MKVVGALLIQKAFESPSYSSIRRSRSRKATNGERFPNVPIYFTTMFPGDRFRLVSEIPFGPATKLFPQNKIPFVCPKDQVRVLHG